MENKGFKVEARITFGDKVEKVTMRNVTEIHYKYPTLLSRKSIAFESDIHVTGCTYEVGLVEEFEAKLEKEIADSF